LITAELAADLETYPQLLILYLQMIMLLLEILKQLHLWILETLTLNHLPTQELEDLYTSNSTCCAESTSPFLSLTHPYKGMSSSSSAPDYTQKELTITHLPISIGI